MGVRSRHLRLMAAGGGALVLATLLFLETAGPWLWAMQPCPPTWPNPAACICRSAVVEPRATRPPDQPSHRNKATAPPTAEATAAIIPATSAAAVLVSPVATEVPHTAGPVTPNAGKESESTSTRTQLQSSSTSSPSQGGDGGGNSSNGFVLPSETMHVVTIGDSITRYQYLDLVWALHSGSPELTPGNLVWERHYMSWVSFFENTTRAFGGHMKCDCYRPQTVNCLTETCVENRFYKHPTAPLWLTHLQLFGDLPMTARVPLNESKIANVTGALGVLHYATDLATVLREHIRYLNPPPTHVVINCGIWKHEGLTANVSDVVAAARLVTHRVVWKESSLPYCPSHWLPTVEALNDWNAYRNPFRDLDKAMKDDYCGHAKKCRFFAFPGPPQRPSADYYDGVHLKPAIYREWNREMWRMLLVLNNTDAEATAPPVQN